MMLTEQESSEKIISGLIEKDFQMMTLFERLDRAGFIGLDFPSITYEIFDLMEIAEEFRSDKLLDDYTQWGRQMSRIKNETERENYLRTVYKELSRFGEFSYVHP